LSSNPLDTPSTALASIRVLQSWVGGVRVDPP
jgi:hypothetical protein